MEEVLGFLCGATIFLTFITVIGHGIWIAVAAALRWLSGTAKPVSAEACPVCGGRLDAAGQKCLRCPYQKPAHRPTGFNDDIEAAERQLRRLHFRGILGSDDFQRLINMLQDESRRLERIRQGKPLDSRSPERPEPKPAPARPAEEPLYIADSEPIEAIIVDDEPTPLPPAAPVERRQPTARPMPSPQPAAKTESPFAPSHALDRDYTEPPPEPPVVRQRIADLMQAFMAEKNIRWGELVSGLLIVGSAVGLVISLRTTLNETVPYFPALLFLLVTYAIYGAGIYTLRRWNLRSTSRGVLIISLLLTPLNFVAAITMSGKQQRPVTDPIFLLAVTVGMAATAWITYSAGRAIIKSGWWRLTVAVLATCVGQVIVHRQGAGDGSLGWTAAIMGLPLAGFLAATVSQLAVASRWQRVSGKRAERTFLVLGLASFSLAAPIGFYLAESPSLGRAVAGLSPLLSLIAASVLGTGLLVHRRTEARSLAAVRATGTSLAIVGGVAMIAAVILAWPAPELLIAVGLANTVMLLALAITGRLPALHTAAMVCLAMATLVGFHLYQGNVAVGSEAVGKQLLWAFGMARSGIVLSGIAVLATSATVALARAGRLEDARAYAAGAGVLGILSIVIACFAGFGPGADTEWATAILAFYTIGTLAAAVVLGRSDLAPLPILQTVTIVGSSLLLATMVQGYWMNEVCRSWLANAGLRPQRPLMSAALIHANCCAALSMALVFRRLLTPSEQRTGMFWQGVVLPLNLASLVVASVALPAALWVGDQQFATHAGYMAAIAAVWLMSALVLRSPVATGMFQATAAITIAFLATADCGRRGWGQDWFTDPRHVHTQLVALALWCGTWCVLRRVSRGWRIGRERIAPLRCHVDDVILGGLVVALLLNSWRGCWPGVSCELGFIHDLPMDGSYRYAFAPGGWIAGAMILAACGLSLWERFSMGALLGFVLTLAAVPLLMAAQFEHLTASASALRWMFAGYTLAIAAAVWLRGPIARRVKRWTWLGWEEFPRSTCDVIRETTLLLGAGAVVLLTTTVVLRVLGGATVGQPSLESFWGNLSTTTSFAVPLLAVVAVLVGHAVRERSTTYAASGSIILQYVVTLACLLHVGKVDASLAVSLVQWNAFGLGSYALLWLSLERRIRRNAYASRHALSAQLVAAGGAVAALAVWSALAIFLTPGSLHGREDLLGTWPSYLAFAVTTVAVVWHGFRQWGRDEAVRRSLDGLIPSAMMLTALIAASVDASDASRMWHGYHALTFGWLAVAAAAVAVGFRWDRISRLAEFVCGSVVVLALRGCLHDPHPWAPAWSISAVLGVALLSVVTALRQRNQWHAYASTLLGMTATAIYWLGPWLGRWPRDDMQAVVDFLVAVTLAGIGGAGLWLGVEIWFQRSRNEAGLDDRFPLIGVHSLMAIAATVATALLVGCAFAVNFLASLGARGPVVTIDYAGGIALLSLLGLMLAASLWERRAGFGLPCLYVWGLVATVSILDWVRPHPEYAFFGIGMMMSVYVAATGLLWRQGVGCADLGRRLSIPEPVEGLRRTSTWLPIVNMLMAALSMLVGLISVLAFEQRELRIWSGFGPLFVAIGLGAMAQKERRDTLQFMSLLMTGAAAAYLSWADIHPAWDGHTILLRIIRLLMVFCGLAFVYGAIVARRVSVESTWSNAVRRIAGVFGVLALTALVCVLACEIVMFQPGVGAPIETPQVVAVAVVLVALIAGLISLAILPGYDPFAFTEQGRMGYVYAAEAVGGLLFLHVFLCRPDLFAGFFQPYWPYIVLAIAYAGVGAGELLRRSGIRVLSEPLGRTGVFLPLAPVTGIWLVAAEQTDYATLLFLAGLMYLVLALLRESVILGIIAAVAGNAALWSLLGDTGIAFWDHPQYWLIPPALSVLTAAHVNRHRLAPAQLAALRYSSILIIYLSSTCEIYLSGIGESLWPPIILTSLSVAGVFAGFILRIRAFLYLGVSFVFVSVLSMVWHAARAIEHVWPWWAFGIGLGICILVLFGVFEKKRPEITRWIERLREWDQ